ncbi:hypothetical protein, partial [Kitasatospora aureofaciens]
MRLIGAAVGVVAMCALVGGATAAGAERPGGSPHGSAVDTCVCIGTGVSTSVGPGGSVDVGVDVDVRVDVTVAPDVGRHHGHRPPHHHHPH